MTEEAEQAAVTAPELTDEKVTEFFDNDGQFKEEPKIEASPEQETAESEEERKKNAPVNYGALHEERQRRRELQAQVDEYKKKEAEWHKAQPAKQEVSFDDDPVEVLRRENEEIKGFLNFQAQTAIQQRNNQQYWAKVNASENAFKQDVPDFDDAVGFLATSRKEELMDLGWDEAGAAEILADEIKWIADKAYADEVNPAERFYNLAKRRGFKAKEDGTMKAIESKLSNIEKGIKTNRSLPPASKSVSKDLTAEDLAAMTVDVTNPDAFNSAWEKLYGKG